MKNNFSANVLIISSAEKGQFALKSLLLDHHYGYQIKICKSGVEARRELLNQSYDLVLLNTPLQDEFGDKLAIHIKEQTNSEVLIFIKNENYALVFENIVSLGIFAISKPIVKDIAIQVLNIAQVNSIRNKEYLREKEKLEQKLNELKIVSKAKCILIETHKMTEEQAHHFIENEAMNGRCKKIEIALQIINKNKIGLE